MQIIKFIPELPLLFKEVPGATETHKHAALKLKKVGKL